MWIELPQLQPWIILLHGWYTYLCWWAILRSTYEQANAGTVEFDLGLLNQCVEAPQQGPGILPDKMS